MKPCIYRGIKGEIVPNDVTHLFIDESVTIIKEWPFFQRTHLVSIVMADNVKIIETGAFSGCSALRFVRLSKTLEYIGNYAFARCWTLESLFLPSTVNLIGDRAFSWCKSLRFLIQPKDIDAENIGHLIVHETTIEEIASLNDHEYDYDPFDGKVSKDSNNLVNEWLIHHMEWESQQHNFFYTSSIDIKEMKNYLREIGNDLALDVDFHHTMAPLHMLSINLYASTHSIAALLKVSMEAIFSKDNQLRTPLDYAREYNVGGLLATIASLCKHRNSCRSGHEV
mmetsp:Transcript_20190/g.30592  ORF Transcript_20190/g.30592 Transcript_20190/m.30592 type:complete len:282 (-) Transcript_20190:131-976(-)